MSVKKYDFFKTKYGDELLIDLIHLETLEKYMVVDCPHYLTYYDITLLIDGKGYFCVGLDGVENIGATATPPCQRGLIENRSLPLLHLIRMGEELRRSCNGLVFVLLKPTDAAAA